MVFCMLFYLWENDNVFDVENPPPEHFIGKIPFQEMYHLRFFWDDVSKITNIKIPDWDSDMIIRQHIIPSIYDLCLTMHKNANYDYYVTHKSKKVYMLLYDNILEILKVAYNEKKGILLYEEE